MTDYIAFCGLDCEQCEARIATVNDDNELRKKVAEIINTNPDAKSRLEGKE